MTASHRHNPEQALITRQDRQDRRRAQDLARARSSRVPDARSREAIRSAFQAYAAVHGMDAVFFAGLAELVAYAPKLKPSSAARREAERLFSREEVAR